MQSKFEWSAAISEWKIVNQPVGQQRAKVGKMEKPVKSHVHIFI